MRKRGEITVFLSLCLLCVAALICVMVESARMEGSRYYFQTAMGGALDSLFSRYDRELWRRYRILGLPYESEEELAGILASYVSRYLEVDNWYPAELDGIEIGSCEDLADQGGDHLTEEILDYMKYGVWSGLEIRPDDGGQFLKDIQEAAGAGELADVYDGQEREVRKLEKAVEKIAECAAQQEEYAEEIAGRLAGDDADGFRKSAGKFRREAGRMDGLVEQYEKQAARLAEKLADTRKRIAETEALFQEDRAKLFEEQMDPYDAYLSEDGARRQEILGQLEAGRENLALLEQTEALVSEAEEAWKAREAWEEEMPEQAEEGGSIAASGGAAKEREELSLAAAAARWSSRTRCAKQPEYAKGDDQKRGFLDQVKSLAENGLLELVLPSEMQVSSGCLPDSLLSESAERDSLTAPGPLERVLLHEYCGRFFTNALSDEKKPVQYEMEYLLQAEDSDRRNLEKTVTQLLLVRQGLNLIHILSDPAKREEAHSLAVMIVGAAGLAPLTEITACFIMGVWATGEAVTDLRTLLSGGRVPLWKSREDWKLSLEGLLSMGEEKACPETEEEGTGFTYESYLKLLLFLTDHQDLQLRMLDIMEMNIEREEAGFSVEKCAYRVDVCGKAGGKHVFFSLPFVENIVGQTGGYPLEAPAERAY